MIRRFLEVSQNETIEAAGECVYAELYMIQIYVYNLFIGKMERENRGFVAI